VSVQYGVYDYRIILVAASHTRAVLSKEAVTTRCPASIRRSASTSASAQRRSIVDVAGKNPACPAALAKKAASNQVTSAAPGECAETIGRAQRDHHADTALRKPGHLRIILFGQGHRFTYS